MAKIVDCLDHKYLLNKLNIFTGYENNHCIIPWPRSKHIHSGLKHSKDFNFNCNDQITNLIDYINKCWLPASSITCTLHGETTNEPNTHLLLTFLLHRATSFTTSLLLKLGNLFFWYGTTSIFLFIMFLFSFF